MMWDGLDVTDEYLASEALRAIQRRFDRCCHR